MVKQYKLYLNKLTIGTLNTFKLKDLGSYFKKLIQIKPDLNFKNKYRPVSGQSEF